MRHFRWKRVIDCIITILIETLPDDSNLLYNIQFYVGLFSKRDTDNCILR